MKALYIEPRSPWENGYCESFNGKLRDECLNREIFYMLREAQVLIEQWRNFYNTERPHSALSYRPPAPKPCCLHQVLRITPSYGPFIKVPSSCRILTSELDHQRDPGHN